MGDKIQSKEDIQIYREERSLVARLRDAITFCKQTLEI